MSNVSIERYTDLVAFASFCASECIFTEPGHVVAFFERPSKWEREFKLWGVYYDELARSEDNLNNQKMTEAICQAMLDNEQNEHKFRYGDYTIETGDYVASRGLARWEYCHEDYDGGEGSGDSRCGFGRTLLDIADEIDEMELQMREA